MDNFINYKRKTDLVTSETAKSSSKLKKRKRSKLSLSTSQESDELKQTETPTKTLTELFAMGSNFPAPKAKKRDKAPFPGLINRGQNCYIIVVVQMLFYIPKCQHSLRTLQKELNKKNIRDELLQELIEIFDTLSATEKDVNINENHEMQLDENRDVDAKEISSFLEILRTRNTFSCWQSQQDTQEFFVFLTSHLISLCDQNFDVDNVEYSQLLPTTISGKIQFETGCCECENVNKKSEDFVDLSVPIVASSLEQILNKQMDYEMLNGENKYNCDTCHVMVEGTKRTMISKLPQVFFFHLQRARYVNSNIFQSSKQTEETTLPLSLNFENWCIDECNYKHLSYDLLAIICHKGSSAASGHYVCYIREPNQKSRWLLFDDSKVFFVDKDEIEDMLAGKLNNCLSPYMLAYERQSNE